MADSEGKNDKNKTDSTSFASILAGVKRMREQYEGTNSTSPAQATAQPTASQPQGNNGSMATSISTSSNGTIRPGRTIQSSTSTTPGATSHNVTTTIDGVPRTRTVLLETTGIPIQTTRPTAPAPARNDPSRMRNRPAGRIHAPSDILVSKAQDGNPLLKESMMKITPWKFDADLLSDYYINPTLQFLFLSLKYHKLKPEYIWQRLKRINKGASTSNVGSDRSLRILLVVVDIESHQDVLRSLSDFCIKHDLTLVLAWSFEEAGNYIVFAKQLDNAPTSKASESIKGIRGVDYNSNVVEAMTSIRSINKTDVSNLLANCKSIKNIVVQSCGGSNRELGNIGGLGATKLKNLREVFSEPFIYNKQYQDLEEIEGNASGNGNNSGDVI